jgi:ankyrin repeat protein
LVKLKYDELLSNFAFKFNLRPYNEAACALSRQRARFDDERRSFEDERRSFAEVLVAVAGNQRGKNTALSHASQHAKLAHVVERLIAAGAAVNSTCPLEGHTALHIAANHGRGGHEMSEQALDRR